MKKIPDFPGYYATTDGCIFSTRGRWGKTTVHSLKPSAHYKDGYLSVKLRHDNRTYIKSVSRLILETFVGMCPDGMECCHYNGVKTDNCLHNLRWDTHVNNTKDAIRHGTFIFPQGRGEKHGGAKLNTAQVRVIKHLLQDNIIPQIDIAKIFKVCYRTINSIKHNENWASVII